MRPLSLLPALILSVQAWAQGPIPWAEPSFTELEKVDGEALRSPWDDIRDVLEVGPRSWDKKDDAERMDLLRQAYKLYVNDLSNLQSSGWADRQIYDIVTGEQVKKVKLALGQESAGTLAAVRSKLVIRRFDLGGVLVSQGLEWLEVFDPPQAERIRKQIDEMKRSDAQAREGLKNARGALAKDGKTGRLLDPNDFHHGVDGSVEREDIPVRPQGSGNGAPDYALRRGREPFTGEDPSAKIGLRTSKVPYDMTAGKTPQKSLEQIDEDRRNGMGTMGLGVLVGGVGAFVCTINPWAGGVMVAGGATMIYAGYEKMQENTLTEAQSRELEAQQDRSRKKWGL